MSNILLGAPVGPNGPFPILGKAIAEIVGNADLTLNQSQYTNYYLQITSDGSMTTARNVIAPLTAGYTFLVENATTEGFPVVIGGASGSTVSVPSRTIALISCNGTNYTVPTTAGVTTNTLAALTVVDPSNVSGLATDTGPGTSAAPLLTTAELNRRLVTTYPSSGGAQVDLFITYLSDELAGAASLDMSLFRGTGLIVQVFGTPTVLHSGTLTSGTTAINPSASSGGQQQTAEDTALGANGWLPYVGNYLRIVGGPRAGTTSWIVANDTGTSSAWMDRPMTSGFLAGSILSGDSYQIVRPTKLTFGNVSPQVQSSYLIFQDITFLEPNPTGIGLGSTIQTVEGNYLALVRCVSGGRNIFTSSIYMTSCWIAGLIAKSAVMTAGVYSSSTNDQIGVLSIGSDTCVIGDGLLLQPGVIGELTVTIGFGAGVQFQGCASAAITVDGQVVVITTDTNSHPLLWGSRNAITTGTPAVVVAPGSTLVVPSVTPPTVTGPNGDWQVGAFNTPCRAWNEATGAYGGQISTRTWANLMAGIGSGGFALNAHNVGLESHLIAAG